MNLQQPRMPVLAWARSPVAPVGGGLAALQTHEIAAPVLLALLARTGLPAHAVDTVVLGNALGAGGNPARMLALAAGLPDGCRATSVDSQCCAGLDAVALAVGLLASGQAEVVVAGGAEAWSRAPQRLHRPLQPGDVALPYERPAFAPDPARDPDLLAAAAHCAWAAGHRRSDQDAYALASHARAVAHATALRAEIVPMAGLDQDSYPRALSAPRAARMPVCAQAPQDTDGQYGLSTLAIAPKADGAGLLLLATPAACARWGLQPSVWWAGAASTGGAPETPMHCAQQAAQAALQQAGWAAASLHTLELHDAFATQGLALPTTLGLPPERLNPWGGGLSRGHPIGASGAIALVRVLAQLAATPLPPAAAALRGLACIAGAGGLGSATLIEWTGNPPTAA